MATATGQTQEEAVDIGTIEQQKENIQPLASGRSATQLTNLFSARTPSSARRPLGSAGDADDDVGVDFNPKTLSKVLKEGHAKYQGLIEALERAERGEDDEKGEELMDDPLDVYLQYVRWTQDSYPSGGSSSESRLVPLLEKATRRFVRDPRYTSDLRYLKLWHLYADQCPPHPARDIFRFLISNDIGTSHSHLYEKYALVLEQCGARQEADAMFSLGINRKAVPLERLRKKRDAFLARMATAGPLEPSPTESAARPSGPRKGGLGAAGFAPQTKGNPNGARMKIFVDGDEPEQQGVAGQPSRWEDVGTVKSNRRENEIQATAWKGQTMPMGPAVTPGGRLKLDIYHDDDALAPTPIKQAGDPLATPGNVFGPRNARGPTETEMLQLDPLRFFQDAGLDIAGLASAEEAAIQKSKQPPPPTNQIAPASQKPRKGPAPSSATPSVVAPASSGEKREKVACDLSNIYPADEPGAEYSWEEVRARKYAQAQEAKTGVSWGQSEWEVEARKTQKWHKIEADGKPLLHDAKTGEPLWNYLRPAWEAAQSRQHHVEDSEVTLKDDGPSRRHRAPSPTMNTRAALAEVDDMFAGTLNLDKYGQRDDEPGSAGAEGPEEFEDTFWEKSQSQPPRLFTQSQSQALSQSQSQAPFVPFSNPEEEDDEEDEDEDTENGAAGAQEQSTSSVSGNVSLSRSSSSELALASRPSSAFKPVRRSPSDENAGGAARGRTPLGVKGGLLGAPRRLFTVRQDSQLNAFNQNVPAPPVEDGFDVVPDSQPDPIEHEEFEEPLHDPEQAVPATPMGDGYDMGRQRGNRFANLIDPLTPITERTFEFTSTSGFMGSKHLIEEEDEEEEASAAAFDQAFVAGEASRVQATGDDGPAVAADASRRGDESFEGRTHRSFNASTSLELPSGLEVTGNQSGYTVGMLVDKTSTMNLAATAAALASPERSERSIAVPSSPTTYHAGEPVCPFDPEIISCLLSGLDPPLSDLPTYRDHSSEEAKKMDGLQKRAKARARRSSGSQSGRVADEAGWELALGGDLFYVRDKLGEGAFGAVFRVAQADDDDATDDADDDGGEGSRALKVERPPNPWEYTILAELHKRLPARTRQSVVTPHRFYAFADESFLLMDYCDQGSLLQAVNKATSAGLAPAVAGGAVGFDEIIAMFFTIELLRIIETVHAAGFVHGDLKIDNCLLRLQDVPGGTRNWSSTYDREGGGGWAAKGLKLIDYGRTIDTTVFPEGQHFVADWETDKYDCAEMRDGRPWTFEPDYHGVASIAYCMLFGSFMTDSDAQKPPFRRYHQTELWTKLFDALLRPAQVPNTVQLGSVRAELEDWLTSNCEKGGKSLKGFLRKLELASMSH